MKDIQTRHNKVKFNHHSRPTMRDKMINKYYNKLESVNLNERIVY